MLMVHKWIWYRSCMLLLLNKVLCTLGRKPRKNNTCSPGSLRVNYWHFIVHYFCVLNDGLYWYMYICFACNLEATNCTACKKSLFALALGILVQHMFKHLVVSDHLLLKLLMQNFNKSIERKSLILDGPPCWIVLENYNANYYTQPKYVRAQFRWILFNCCWLSSLDMNNI